MATLDVRPSPIAGTWYPGDSKTLASSVDKYLADAKFPPLNGKVMGVISPHAGHIYSGPVAAYAFAALRGLEPDIVAVISPFHNYAPYPLITSRHKAYSTPLGEIDIDMHALADLQSRLDVPITAIPNDKEHSLEIELPFLQRVLKKRFKLLPIMIRAQEKDIAEKLGNALAETLNNWKVLFVASTDLSHFYDQKTASILDQEMLKRFARFDPNSIFEAENSGKAFACGHAAVAAVMWATKKLGGNKVQILNYGTSGDVTRDYSSVVGYGAAAILKTI